jgi:hypothetical protein
MHWRLRVRQKNAIYWAKPVYLETLLKQKRPQDKPWQSHNAVRVISFLISLLAILTLAALIIPGAKITISPQVETQSMILPVTADPSLSVVNHSTGSLPVDTLNVIVEDSISIEATGTTTIPDKFSSGTIRLKNISDHVVPVHKAIVTTLEKIRYDLLQQRNKPINCTCKNYWMLLSKRSPRYQEEPAAGSLIAIEGEVGLELAATDPTHLWRNRCSRPIS